MKTIDDYLNNTTMYRLILYSLIILLVLAVIYSFLGLLPFTPLSLIFTTAFITSVSYIVNEIFCKVFKIPANAESILITALILSLIITPIPNLSNLPFLFWVSAIASASKFIFAYRKKHLFNPAAFAVFITSITINSGASWWVGTFYMVIPTLILGILLVRKIKRTNMVLSFLAVSITTIILATVLNGNFSLSLIKRILADTPILFFAFIMLTEPLTSPPTKKFRLMYGAFIGFLFSPQIHLGTFYTTPEIALLLGNVFSYIVSPKEKLLLRLSQKLQLSPNIYDFIFNLQKTYEYIPGQFMEWTLRVPKEDSRGNRRFLTLASSPTENNLRVGVRFSEQGSAFKRTLLGMNTGDEILAGSLAGEFTLPKNPNQKLAFIAGGIGVTPFRSMIKSIIDEKEKRDIVLFSSVKTEQEAVYMDVFKEAELFGVKTVVNVSQNSGSLTGEKIVQYAPDFRERLFYLSGPHGMVDAFKKTLRERELPKNQIKTDYFPGYV